MNGEIKLLENLKFEASINERHNIIVDGERIAGPSSLDYVLLGLGSCTAISIVTILRRMHENVTAFRVEIEGEQAREPPRVFTKIRLNYIVSGVMDHGNVEKAIKLTFEKYSPSSVMFQKAGVELEHTYTIIQ